MKSLIVIPLVVATFLGIVTALLIIGGVRIRAADPLTAGVIAAGAGVLGVAPILAARRKDAVTVFQMALVGTVLHLFAAVGLTIAAMGAHLVEGRLAFMGWLLAGYWASLVALVLQLRRLIVATTSVAKAQH
jgi:hypothetical protein